MLFDRTKLKILPLSTRKSKSSIEKIAIDPDLQPPRYGKSNHLIEKIADAVLKANKAKKSVIIAFGAHLIKNGLGLVLRNMVKRGWIMHLATNGAGSIHDWEFAFHGRSEEDVRGYVQQGQFGIWEETGKYLNLALLLGAAQGKGYGESIAEFIGTEKLDIPEPETLKISLMELLSHDSDKVSLTGGVVDLYAALKKNYQPFQILPETIHLKHPFKHYSIQNAAYEFNVLFTVHPGFGYDIIYHSPFNSGAAIGRTAEVDWLRFVATISNLDGGVYISIGSAIMSPMIFEKALSLARNVAIQQGQQIGDFMIVVNDIQDSGDWQWGTGKEPPRDSPAYYLRFCKTFDRMGAREMHYVCEDNRKFLLNLYHCLKQKSS